MLAALEAAGTLDDTLIILTSDHGDALGDHGLPYKGFFYDPMAHVPLIMRGPGVPNGQRCPALVSTVDLVPLFYRSCGVTPPGTLQGEDISKLLSDPAGTIRNAAFSEIGGRTMVLTEQHKFASYSDGSAELYELQTDADETRNLAGKKEYQEVENQLREMLIKHFLSNQSQHSRAVSQPQYRVRRKMEEQYKIHLEAGVKPEDALAPSF